MKILIVLGNEPKKKYLINVDAKSLIEDIKNLLNYNRLDAAIMMAIAGGSIEKEITGDDTSYCYTDLTLMDAGAHWEMLKTI